METILALLVVITLYFVGMYIFGMVNKNTPDFRGDGTPKKKSHSKNKI